MTLDAWLEASTAASGVPLKVMNPATLLDSAALIAQIESRGVAGLSLTTRTCTGQ
jgi:hypothetical protein